MPGPIEITGQVFFFLNKNIFPNQKTGTLVVQNISLSSVLFRKEDIQIDHVVLLAQ